MKLPEKIKGINKIRDTKICMKWSQELKTTFELGEIFRLTERRIQQILYSNKDFVKSNVEWEKEKRVHWWKKQIKKAGDSKRDSADLQINLKHELEGDKPLIHIGHNQFFENIISKPKLETNRIEHASKD